MKSFQSLSTYLGVTVTEPIPVAAAILYRQGSAGVEILSARRAKNERFGGQWEFPGGKFEPGETAVQALRRELLEELSVDLEVGEFLRGSMPDGGWDMGNGYALYPFFAQIPADQKPVMAEMHSEIRWLPIAEVESVEWVAADLPPLRAAVQYLQRLSEYSD